jgi:hypothetical protein
MKKAVGTSKVSDNFTKIQGAVCEKTVIFIYILVAVENLKSHPDTFIDEDDGNYPLPKPSSSNQCVVTYMRSQYTHKHKQILVTTFTFTG